MDRNESYYRRVVGSIGVSLLIFLLLFELFSVFVSFLLPWLKGVIAQNGIVAATVTDRVLYAAGYLLCFMLPVAFLKLFIKRSGYSYQPMRAPLRVSRYLPLLVLGGIALIFSAAYLNSLLMDFLVGDSTLQSTEQSAPLTTYEIVLEFLVVCLVPGICEEFLFRGAILSNCLPFGRANAVLISSLLFGLMHRNGSQIFYAFAAGILLGLVYEYTGSIWNCVILHTLNNSLSLLERVISDKILDEILAYTYIYLVNVILFLLGIVSIVILMLRFFAERDTQYKNGFFGKQLPACDAYAAYPIAPGRAVRLFFTPTMIVFLSMCAAQILLLMLLTLAGGLL